jgi:phosphohistidine swiveling domain-containing protein
MLTPDQQYIFGDFVGHTDWFVKTFEARQLTFQVQVLAVLKMQQTYSWSQHFGGYISEPRNLQRWFWKQSEMLRQREEFIHAVLHSPVFLDEFERAFFSALERAVEAEDAFTASQQGSDIRTNLAELVRVVELQQEVGRHGYLADCFLSIGSEDWLLPWFARELPEHLTERASVIQTLLAPTSPSVVQQADTELWEIALQDRGSWPEQLAAYASKWHWIENSYFESAPLTAEDFRGRLEHLLASGGPAPEERIAEAKRLPEVRRQEKQAAIDRFQLSSELQRVLDLAERISRLVDLRKMSVLRLNGVLWQAGHDLATTTGQEFTALVAATPWEWLEIVPAEDWDRLRRLPTEGMITLLHNGELTRIAGADFAALDLTPFRGGMEPRTHLSGQGAVAGSVRGTARIVRGRSDFDRFNDGEILVTNQTTPEFVPLMKRAKAIVTDQGGITCHAAIIARELNIPCVIGTQHATEVIRDGSTIEINGETGEVRLELPA